MQVKAIVFSGKNSTSEVGRDLGAGDDIAAWIRRLLAGRHPLACAPQHDRRRRRLYEVERERHNDRPECEDRNQDDKGSSDAAPVDAKRQDAGVRSQSQYTNVPRWKFAGPDGPCIITRPYHLEVSVLKRSRMHSIGGWRRVVTTAALLASATSPLQAQERVRLGIEVLLSDSMHLVRGKRVGLITNHTGVVPDGRSTIDLLHRANGVRLTALFAPEHGLRGQADAGERIQSSVDSATGVPIHSLYGDTRVPTAEMLKDVDVVLYDIQDVGARIYTYQWTMALSAEAVTTLGREFIVLDRPNPIRGDVQGGILDVQFRSFVGQFPVALRYGFTAGELIRYLVGTQLIKAKVKVVPMQGWKRNMWWEQTGIPWRNPSPNIRSVDAAILYTGTAFFEGQT